MLFRSSDILEEGLDNTIAELRAQKKPQNSSQPTTPLSAGDSALNSSSNINKSLINSSHSSGNCKKKNKFTYFCFKYKIEVVIRGKILRIWYILPDTSHEQDETSVMLSQTEQEPNAACVTLRRTGYYIIPSIDKLDEYVRGHTCIVPDFTVGRKGYGNVYFPDSFDIYGLNLDEIGKLKNYFSLSGLFQSVFYRLVS